MTAPTFAECHPFIDQHNKIFICLFHHSDMDGYMAAASAVRKVRSLSKLHGDKDFQYLTVPVNYGKYKEEEILATLNMHEGYQRLFFVLDFAFDLALSDKLDNGADFFRVIDHHEKNQENLMGRPYGYFDMTASGAAMTYRYFSEDAGTEEKMPLAVILADNRDMWRKTTGFEDQFHEVLMYLRSSVYTTEQTYVDELTKMIDSDSHTHSLIGQGDLMVKKRDSNISAAGRDSQLILGYLATVPAIFVNYPVDQSDMGEFLYSKPEFKDRVIAIYSINERGMNFSLRRHAGLSVNLSDLASLYGGGGHSVSAGFNVSYKQGMDIVTGKEKWTVAWNASDLTLFMNDHGHINFNDLKALPLSFVSRSVCEDDTSLRQPIIYVVVRDKDSKELFMYQRPGSGTETKLHGAFSIGLGGHIDRLPSEQEAFSSWLADEATRELQEELGIDADVSAIAHAQIIQKLESNDYHTLVIDDGAVERVHAGLCVIVDVEDLASKINPNLLEVHNYSLRSVEAIKTLIEDGAIVPEKWTNEVIRRLSN